MKFSINEIENMVLHSVNLILNEAKSVDSLLIAFKKKNPDLDIPSLKKLIMADPTSYTNNYGEFAGKYATWIGNLFAKNELKVGDIPELKSALNTFNINKSQLPPINQIKSISDLIFFIKDFNDDFKPSKSISKASKDLEIIYEDDSWVIYIPHSWEASRKIAGDTQWCTASSNPSYFTYYTKKGPLYININKATNQKYQLHFQSRSFMNSQDEPFETLYTLPQKVLDFYKKLNFNYFTLLSNPDSISEVLPNGSAVYNNNSFVDIHGNVILKDVIIKPFLYKPVGFILENTDNQELIPLDEFGNLLLPNEEPFADISHNFTKDGKIFTIFTKFDGSSNIMHPNDKKLFFKNWYVEPWIYDNFFTFYHGKKKFISNLDEDFSLDITKCDLMFVNDFDDFLLVKNKQKKYNIININLGKFIYDIWFDNIYFHDNNNIMGYIDDIPYSLSINGIYRLY